MERDDFDGRDRNYERDQNVLVLFIRRLWGIISFLILLGAIALVFAGTVALTGSSNYQVMGAQEVVSNANSLTKIPSNKIDSILWEDMYFNPYFAILSDNAIKMYEYISPPPINYRYVLETRFGIPKDSYKIGSIGMKLGYPYSLLIYGVHDGKHPFKAYYVGCYDDRECGEIIVFASPSQEFFNNINNKICSYLVGIEKEYGISCLSKEFNYNSNQISIYISKDRTSVKRYGAILAS